MTDLPVRGFPDDEAIRRAGRGMIACALPRAEWTHEAHLAVCAWIILERPDIVPELDLPDFIRRYNESVGGVNDDSQGYHETITQLYIRGVRAALQRSEGRELVERVNALLREPEGGRDWPLRFYSRELLFSKSARLGWVEPDLRPIADEVVHPFRTRHVSASTIIEAGDENMADLSQVREHMEIVGADGVKVGTVDKVQGDRIKMTKPDSGSHSGHHHYISGGLVAAVDGDRVRLTANADAAVLLEEEKSGGAIMDGGRTWTKVLVGAAVIGAAAAAGTMIYRRRQGSSTDSAGGETEVDVVFEPDTQAASAPPAGTTVN